MSYSRPSSYPYPSSFKNIKDVEEYQKKLYASLMENDRNGEFYRDRATPADLKDMLYRPEWYGAKGDGVTDDTTAVQAAADACNTAGGGIILFGPKTYICNFTVGSDTTLQGSGIRQTILKAKGGSNASVVQGKNFATLTGKAYAVGDHTLGDNNICIFDLTIDGNKATQSTGYGVRVWGKNHHWMNVFVQNCKESGINTEFTTIDGNSLDDLLESNFINIKTAHNDADGWLFWGPHDTVIENYITVANGGWGLNTGGTSNSTSLKGSHWNSWNNTTGSYYIADCISVTHIVASGPDGTGIEIKAGCGSCKLTGATIGGHEIGLILRGSSHIFKGQILNCSYPGYGTGNGDGIILDGAIGCIIDIDADGCDNLIKVTSEAGRNIITGIASIGVGDTLFDPSMPTGDYINLITIGGGATQSQYVNFPESDVFTIGGWSPDFPTSNDTLVAQPRTWTAGAAAPTTGTGAAGDVHINSYPSQGLPVGWMCTVAGSPGTWVAMQDLTGGVPIYTTAQLTDLTDGVIPYSKPLADSAEVISNGGFDSDTTDWRTDNDTLASVAGGQAGNCLQITRTGAAYQTAVQDLAGLTVGATYVCSMYVKSGTSGNEAFDFRWYDSTLDNTSNVSGTSSGSWVQYSFRFTATTATGQIGLYKMTATVGTMLFDTVSIKLAPGLSDSPLTTDGTDVDNSGVYKVDGVQVVGNRVIDARADDVANSGDATTDGLIDALRDAMIAHGLIAAS